MDPDLPYFVGFSVFSGIGPVRFRHLYEYFGSARAAWEAPVSDLRNINLGEKLIRDFSAFRSSHDVAGYLSFLAALNISTVTIRNPKYPRLLRETQDPPFVLYVRGKRGRSPVDLERTVAVVGARKVTRYGTEVTQRIVADLVASGCTIVSGLAYGVDAVAHRTALDSGGQTIAVLGCGVDVIAPPSNTELYWDIVGCGRGAVVSEMPPGMRPDKGLFPARNRIISGLSRAVLVTEGAEDSGSLITARYAAEQGRDVFAVPGPVTSVMSRGPAKLIKNGAKLVESASDILEDLRLPPISVDSGYQPSPNGVRRGIGESGTLAATVSADERNIIKRIAGERKHIDAIVRESGLTAAAVAAILSVLEVNGIVKDYGDKTYGMA